MPATSSSDFTRDGFLLVEDLISSAQCHLLRETIQSFETNQAGLRDLFRILPQLHTFVAETKIRSLVADLLSPVAFAVRAILFNKTPQSNWFVAWHQDTTIAVRKRVETAGFGPWSTKNGIIHVRPPREILERMVTLRIHLDDCGSENGPLRVIPGSHRRGILRTEELAQLVAGTIETICSQKAGGCIAMSPLLVHASSKAKNPRHRRVLHLEFSDAELPAPLAWYEKH